MSPLPRLGGPQKAALVLMALDEDVAAEVMRHLDEAELRRLAESTETLQGVSPEVLGPVFEEFERSMRDSMQLRGGAAYLRRIAATALGEERAQRLFAPSTERTPLDAIRSARANTLADLLTEEQPQVSAVILSQLSKDRAARVLGAMPQEAQADLVGRIAAMTEVPSRALQLASESLARALEEAGGLSSEEERRDFAGVSFAASLLNELPPADSDRLLGGMSTNQAQLASQIREAMFTFEDLVRLDSRGLQLLMREVPSDRMLMAMKTASETLREKLLSAVFNEALRRRVRKYPPLTGDWRADLEAILRQSYDLQLKSKGLTSYIATHNRNRLFQEVKPGEVDYGLVLFDRVGAILNITPSVMRDEVLKGLEETDAGLAEQVRKTIFTFAHIPARILARDVPKVLRGIDQPTLVMALAGARGPGAEAAEFILANLSQRMAATLREEMAALPKIRDRDADAAQTALVSSIRDLAEAGELVMIADEEED